MYNLRILQTLDFTNARLKIWKQKFEQFRGFIYSFEVQCKEDNLLTAKLKTSNNH